MKHEPGGIYDPQGLLERKSMNIYAAPGTVVLYPAWADAGHDHDKHSAEKYLVKNRCYTVADTVPGDWHTDVYLVEVPGVAFNSVLFADDDGGKREPA